MKKITPVTRRNIFDGIIIEKIAWHGRLSEDEFLSRLYDLTKLPSDDDRFENASGDIWQHRVNNYDWPDEWIFTDQRFQLMDGDDSILLNFLTTMLHPIVRRDATEVARLLQLFNDNLQHDNYEIVEAGKISGQPVFAGRQKLLGNHSIRKAASQIVNYLSEEYVATQIHAMETSIENAPHLSIGIAKELIETICQTILSEHQIQADKTWDLPYLLKQTTKQLQLTPEGIPDTIAAAKTIKTILNSLTVVVNGLSELRNQYGTGHGKRANFKGLTARHARLSVGAASTLAMFLLETHHYRNSSSKTVTI